MDMLTRYLNYKALRNALGSVFIISFYILLLRVQPTQNQEVMETTPASEIKRLREDLFKHYDKTARPVKNQSAPTNVLLFFDVKHIVALDEKYQILTVKGELMMKWTDENLRWDASSYSGISKIRLKPYNIWIPEIHSIYNVKATDIFDKEHSSAVLVYSNGTVKWYPETVFDIPCSTNFRHYPFDSHNCSILLNAVAYSPNEVTLNTLELPMSPTPSVTGAAWRLTNVVHSTRDTTDVYWVVILVKLFLERTSRIYRYIYVVPTLIALISSIFGFWLLPSDSSRYLIGCSNVILMSLMLQNMAATVPSGKDIPLIAVYSATILCMSGAFLLVTVVTDLLRHSSGKPPQAILRLAHQHLDQRLCLNLFSQSTGCDRALRDMSNGSSGSPDGTPPVSPEEEKRRKDWEYISLVVDRLCFLTFVLTYAILLGVLASV